MAICTPQLSGWAGMILEDLGDETTPTGSVVNWLQNNLYLLNTRIHTQYALNESGCIEPDFDQVSSGVYSQMYICNWLSKQAQRALNGFQYDVTRIEGTEQGSVTKVSRNDSSKTLLNLAKDCRDQLDRLILWHNGVYVGQVLYSERCSVTDATLLPPPDCCNGRNRFLRSFSACC